MTNYNFGSSEPIKAPDPPRVGTHDGVGWGDHDQPYRFGNRPSSAWTYPFSARQYARVLMMRGRVADGEFEDDRYRG